MPDYIFEANIAHYKKLLAIENDAQKIETLRKSAGGGRSQACQLA